VQKTRFGLVQWCLIGEAVDGVAFDPESFNGNIGSGYEFENCRIGFVDFEVFQIDEII
jgi:hypothetical protein